MSGTYKATGINLKGTAFGESDRLLTVLTQEYGLVRAIAPGSRKHASSLRGRSGLFVVNQLLIAKGRSLDKIIQAEGLESFAGLSQDLLKLTASQYLAELVLYQALSDQPQDELFGRFRDSLRCLERLPTTQTLACLTHATCQLLTLAGVAPQVHRCCLTQEAIVPDLADPSWQTGFSVAVGGTVTLAALQQLSLASTQIKPRASESASSGYKAATAKTATAKTVTAKPVIGQKPADIRQHLNAEELTLLQRLVDPNFIQADGSLDMSSDYPIPLPSDPIWLAIERLLRQCAEYYFERPIRSAALIDACFLSQPFSA
jgi:DNA repair protein RecO (recombination protein O)